MCSKLNSGFWILFEKLLKYGKNIHKICRVVALLDGLLGLIILGVLLIRKLRRLSKNDDGTGGAVTSDNLLLLALQVTEIGFAVILYEGVRRKVLCMVKIWLLYCVTRFIILVSTIHLTLISHLKPQLRLWMYGAEATFTFFHVSQCIFLLAWHKSTSPESTQVDTQEP